MRRKYNRLILIYKGLKGKARISTDDLVPETKRNRNQTRLGGGLAQWLASQTTNQWVPGSRPGRVAVRYGLEQVTFTLCLVLVKPRKSWTYD